MEWVSHGARYYNSEWGRFISPDPKREFYNQYSYCWDDPINIIDRDGRGGSGIDAKVPVLTSWGNPTDEIFLLSDYGQAICAAKMAEYKEWKQQQLLNDEAEKKAEEDDDTDVKFDSDREEKIVTYSSHAIGSGIGAGILAGGAVLIVGTTGGGAVIVIAIAGGVGGSLGYDIGGDVGGALYLEMKSLYKDWCRTVVRTINFRSWR